MGMWWVPLQGGNSAAVASQQFYDIDRLIRLFSSSVRLTVVPCLSRRLAANGVVCVAGRSTDTGSSSTTLLGLDDQPQEFLPASKSTA
ncbi:hypothetical protein VTP01DRAFT_6265 [Rhizomucor pusillus]|uniref:uncharacterized protein n=1 Tax=Rhizomucor pusillus TaxID=4840 RepID=UPI0037440315